MYFVLANDSNRQAAEGFIEHFQGKSYVEFQFSLVPRGGTYDILVSSDRVPDEDETREVLIGLMYEWISRSITERDEAAERAQAETLLNALDETWGI